MSLRNYLTISLAMLLPVYPLLYVSASRGLIGPDLTFILCTIMDAFTNGFFTHTSLDCLLPMLGGSMNAEINVLESADNKKHVFLKFLLHEVCRPDLCDVLQVTCIFVIDSYS
jgi:hypothetical protein